MRRDAQGFYYFIDRVGETFRWKGENVSTAEVVAALSSIPGVLEAIVYGVAVPGADGRAGMAALVVNPAFDLDDLHRQLAQHLPAYARPVFVRLLPALEATGTFKPKRAELISAGFDPTKIVGPVYLSDQQQQRYRMIDPQVFAGLCAGRQRL